MQEMNYWTYRQLNLLTVSRHDMNHFHRGWQTWQRHPSNQNEIILVDSWCMWIANRPHTHTHMPRTWTDINIQYKSKKCYPQGFPVIFLRRQRVFKKKISTSIVCSYSCKITKFYSIISNSAFRWSGWVWVGECFFWYRPTQVVPDKRPLNGRRPNSTKFGTMTWNVSMKCTAVKNFNFKNPRWRTNAEWNSSKSPVRHLSLSW